MAIKRTAVAIFVALLCATAAFAQGDYSDAPDYDGEDYDGAMGGEMGGEMGDDDGPSMPDGPEVVVDLTSMVVDTFDTEYMKDNRMVMLEMFAPWCGHCKAFAPSYEAAARVLKETFPNVTLAKVDATVNEEMGQKFSIEGYPTVKWIEYVEDGEIKVSDFEAQPDVDAIVNFVKKRAGEAVTVLPADPKDAAAALAAAAAADSAFVVAYFPQIAVKDASAISAFKLFIEAARQTNGAQFMYTSDIESLSAAEDQLGPDAFAALSKAKAQPVIAVSRSAGADKMVGVVYPDILEKFEDSAALQEFIKKEKLPDVVPFSEDNIEMIFGANISYQVLFFGTPEHVAAVADFYADVAVKNRAEYLFISVTLGGDKPDAAAMNVAEYFGVVEEGAAPAVGEMEQEMEEMADPDAPEVVPAQTYSTAKLPEDFQPAVFLFYAPDDVDPEAEVAEGEEPIDPMGEQPQKWKLEGEITKASLEKFLVDHKAGALKPHFKSEEIPAEGEQKGPVTVVVAKSFEDVVMDPTKDVLLEVYAPWCQHCKELEPVYEKLAHRFSPVESMIIAKMDGTKNEHPKVEIGGFPTIMFFPAEAGVEAGIPYPDEEPKTLSGFTKWLKANAKVPYELKKKDKSGKKNDEEGSADEKDEL